MWHGGLLDALLTRFSMPVAPRSHLYASSGLLYLTRDCAPINTVLIAWASSMHPPEYGTHPGCVIPLDTTNLPEGLHSAL